MTPKIGLIGIPLETVPIRDTGLLMPTYLPHTTEKTLDIIVEKAKSEGIQLDNLGEANLGDDYNPGFMVDRIEGVDEFYANRLRRRDMKRLEEARKWVLSKNYEYDLLVCIGPSHLGAITLYEDNDRVARLDYHADFTGWEPHKIAFSYATYMDWVKHNLKDVDITNYFVRWSENGIVFGREASGIEDKSYASANHFDIDVDCFHLFYEICNVFPHISGASDATPEMVLSMIEETKPKKIGIWEYRLSKDYRKIGLNFIVSCMARSLYSS